MYLELKSDSGDEVSKVAAGMVSLSWLTGMDVRCEFNGVTMFVNRDRIAEMNLANEDPVAKVVERWSASRRWRAPSHSSPSPTPPDQPFGPVPPLP